MNYNADGRFALHIKFCGIKSRFDWLDGIGRTWLFLPFREKQRTNERKQMDLSRSSSIWPYSFTTILHEICRRNMNKCKKRVLFRIVSDTIHTKIINNNFMVENFISIITFFIPSLYSVHCTHIECISTMYSV